MANFTPLSRPSHHAVKVDPNPRDSLSDGFAYPTFQLLNKQSRVPLSEPHKVNSVYPYRLLAIANSKGWFAAVRTGSHGTSIAFSILPELRASLKNANENDANLFVPRRLVTLPAEDVNIIAFGMHDTRLLVGFTGGQLLVYDTALLFTAGTNDVAPLSMTKTSSAPFVQIAPNPGTEPDLAQLVAVIRGDGVVQVLDINKLEPQCGWAGEGEAAPVAISWAPKGKHLAIGLRLGDIVTYALSNNTVPHKQIPPTADGYLVSLDWVGPTLAFKTTYSSRIPESSDATLHVVHVDVKSSVGHYFSLMHPFPAADRNKMHALSLSVPRWNEEPGASIESAKGLVIVGDVSSVDLEVLAYMGPQWYQQSQENPLQLPLDKNMNDTILISLEVDLTDAEANVPIMYAYLNDGTLQGWKLDHPKPYLGMVRAETSSTFSGPVVAQESPAFAAAFSPPTTFAQIGAPAFGQSPFVQQTPPFSPQPTFGQTSLSTPTQPPAQATGHSAFNNFSTNAATNVYSQPSFGFGGSLTVPSTTPQQSTSEVITREASMSDETTSLGGLSLGRDETVTPSKGAGGGIFGSFSPSPSASTSAFGGVVKPATGFGAFSNYQSTTPSTTTIDASKSPFSAAGSTSTTPTQPAFGQTGFAKPAFGQPAFGQSSFGKASFSTPTTPGSGGFAAFASAGPNAFTTPSKPPTAPASGGFGGFAGKPTAFGTMQALASGQEKKDTFKPNVPDRSPPSSPEPMVEVKSALPVDDDMSPPASPIKRDSTPISTTPAQPPPAKAFSNLSTPVRPAAGFGAFGGISETSPFFQKGETSTTPTAVFGKPASTTPTNPPPGGLAPKFGATSLPGAAKSAFAPVSSTTTATIKPPTSGGFGAFSGASGAFASFAGSGKSFNELLKEKDEVSDVDKEKGKGIPEEPAPERPSESAALETPKKDEPPAAEPITPLFTPPPEAASTTPAMEPPPKMAEKTRESKVESEKRPVSAEESFVEVTLEEGEIDEEAGAKEVKEDAENEGYLSGSLGPSDSEGSIDGTEDEEEDEEEVEGVLTNEVTETPSRATSIDPTAVPLPTSRSPSAAPEVPSIVVSTESEGKPISVQETSTTPSGTPAKTEAAASPKAAPSTTPTGQPFSIGLSRPSTRPMRSSPLAGTPVTGQDQIENSGKDVGEPKHDVTELKTTSSPKLPRTEPLGKAALGGDVKAPTPQTPPSLGSAFSPTLGFAPGVPLKPATPLPLPDKTESQKKPTSLFGGMTGFFKGPSSQPGFMGSPPASENQATQSKLPLAPKAESGIPASAPFLGALPPRPLSSALTFPPSAPAPSGLNRPASVPPPDLFAKPPAGMTTTSSPFGIKGFAGAPSIFGKPPTQTKPTPPEAPLEEGIQKECALLYNAMNQELEELRLLAQEANRKRQELAKTRGGSDRKTDLGNPLKWGLVDTEHFGQVLKQYGHDLSELKQLRAELKRKVRQVESKMLKAGTRKEEIARFTKAQNDKEFVKMLKSRTLGPEHLENQTQLRRGIRGLRDRIQKLEAHLQTSKRKLAETNSGKPSFRTPTLDTINRTYRNIDLAIQCQADEIGHLSHRVTKLNISTTVKTLTSSKRDLQLPHNESRPFSVTPHIAVTTAAALNAERSAQKLKKALLASRKAPLLNDKAAQVPAARITFKTPQKTTLPDRPGSAGPAFKTPVSGPLFLPETPQTPLPEWSFPDDDFNPSPSPPTRRGAGRTKKHATNAPLKKSVGSVQAAAPSFDWGPLPGFSQPALASVGPPVSLAPKNPPGFVPLTQFKR